MTPKTHEWLDGLRRFAAAERLARAAAEAPATDAFLAAQRAVLAANFTTWIDGSLPAVLEARRRMAADSVSAAGIDPEPAIVVTTSPAGLSAIGAVLDRGDPFIAHVGRSIAVVRETECRQWCIRHPDPDHRRHVNHWSWIKTDVPRKRWSEFSRHPLAAHETYWLHRTGTVGAGDADGRACHLWKWNGAAAVLLEPFVDEPVRRL